MSEQINTLEFIIVALYLLHAGGCKEDIRQKRTRQRVRDVRNMHFHNYIPLILSSAKRENHKSTIQLTHPPLPLISISILKINTNQKRRKISLLHETGPQTRINNSRINYPGENQKRKEGTNHTCPTVHELRCNKAREWR